MRLNYWRSGIDTERGVRSATWKVRGERPEGLALAIAFARFGLVGMSGVLVDMGMLYLLTSDGIGGGSIYLGWAKVFASATALINNFVWNDLWTFKFAARRHVGMKPRLVRLGKFVVICGAGIGLATVVLVAFSGEMGLEQVFGQRRRDWSGDGVEFCHECAFHVENMGEARGLNK